MKIHFEPLDVQNGFFLLFFKEKRPKDNASGRKRVLARGMDGGQ